MSTLDPRLNAIRPDLADASLEGLVDAQRFAQAERMQVMVPVASVRKAPRAAAMQLTQALMGERVKLFERKDGWSWVQLERDGYVGYVETAMLSGQIGTPTHRVAVPSTFIYPEASIKSQPAVLLTMNAQVAVTGADEKFARLTTGQFVHAEHLKPVAGGEHDFVTVAEMFRHVPYYWGASRCWGSIARASCNWHLKPADIRHRATATCRRRRWAQNCWSMISTACGAAIWYAGLGTSASCAMP